MPRRSEEGNVRVLCEHANIEITFTKLKCPSCKTEWLLDPPVRVALKALMGETLEQRERFESLLVLLDVAECAVCRGMEQVDQMIAVGNAETDEEYICTGDIGGVLEEARRQDDPRLGALTRAVAVYLLRAHDGDLAKAVDWQAKLLTEHTGIGEVATRLTRTGEWKPAATPEA